mmetsp:Transcript_20499/g.41027  ORF Transcript_20499/g.41027 Transcript_20499/m.41027 type:complete len:134 (+) Transcript_20499:165-566(+)
MRSKLFLQSSLSLSVSAHVSTYRKLSSQNDTLFNSVVEKISNCDDNSAYFCNFLLNPDQCQKNIFGKSISGLCPHFCGSCIPSSKISNNSQRERPVLQYIGFIFLCVLLLALMQGCVKKKKRTVEEQSCEEVC